MFTAVEIGGVAFDVSLDTLSEVLGHGELKKSERLCVLSYLALPPLRLEDEIRGVSGHLQEVAMLSFALKNIVFCGITTSIGDIRHLSVAVFNSGTLVDIVDRTLALGFDGFEPSDKIKIFSCDYGKLGLLIDKDVLVPANWKKLTPHCDCILSIANTSDPAFNQTALTLSHEFNHPLILTTNTTVSWRQRNDV